MLGTECLWELVQVWVGYQNGDLWREGGSWVPEKKDSDPWERVSEREVNGDQTGSNLSFVLECIC